MDTGNPNDSSQLTVKGNEKKYLNVPAKNYGRRSDLMDPTPWIQRSMKKNSPLYLEFKRIEALGPAAPPSAAGDGGGAQRGTSRAVT